MESALRLRRGEGVQRRVDAIRRYILLWVRTEALQSYADDIVRLLILYYSRVDGDPQGNDKRERVHKAIANFKPVPGFDAEALIKFFKMQ